MGRDSAGHIAEGLPCLPLTVAGRERGIRRRKVNGGRNSVEGVKKELRERERERESRVRSKGVESIVWRSKAETLLKCNAVRDGKKESLGKEKTRNQSQRRGM